VALRPGLVLANPARLNDDSLPKILKQWKVIYSPPMENTDRYDPEYLSMCIGSDWIDMNSFSISPNLVVVDRNQPTLIKLLEREGLDVIPLKLRHSKLLGGGPHCVTLDCSPKRDVGTVFRLNPFHFEMKLSSREKSDIACSNRDPEKNFEEFWQTFNNRYPFFEVRNVDWRSSMKLTELESRARPVMISCSIFFARCSRR
jgi:hypothetical protein